MYINIRVQLNNGAETSLGMIFVLCPIISKPNIRCVIYAGVTVLQSQKRVIGISRGQSIPCHYQKQT